MLTRQVADHLDVKVDPAVCAGVAGRADNHRHSEAASGEQHGFEIVPLPLPRARRDIGAERPRPDIARSGIRANQVWDAVAADPEAADLDWRKAEMSVRTDNSQRIGG